MYLQNSGYKFVSEEEFYVKMRKITGFSNALCDCVSKAAVTLVGVVSWQQTT